MPSAHFCPHARVGTGSGLVDTGSCWQGRAADLAEKFDSFLEMRWAPSGEGLDGTQEEKWPTLAGHSEGRGEHKGGRQASWPCP